MKDLLLRLCLRAYSRATREQRGEEIVGLARDLESGGRSSFAREAGGLIVGGLRERITKSRAEGTLARKLGVLVGIAIALIAVSAVANLVVAGSLGSQANGRLIRAAQEQAGMLDVGQNGVSMPRPAAGQTGDVGLQTWVFVGGKTLTAPVVDAETASAAKSLDGSSGQFLDVPGRQARLYAIAVYYESSRIGTIVTGMSTASYYQARVVTLVITIAFSGLFLLLAGFLVVWTFRVISAARSNDERNRYGPQAACERHP